jgi:hypothetical protein
MKQYLRCKACGFIIEEGNLGDFCPACGVKKTMFIPDPDKLSEKRRLLMDSHIHPIIVHAPQAFALFLLLFAIASLVLRGTIQLQLITTFKVLSIILPFMIIGSFVSGIFDAKVRFKKVTAPLLKQKIVVGIVFFACSLPMGILSVFTAQNTTMLLLISSALSLACFICTALLGKWGASMINSKFQG